MNDIISSDLDADAKNSWSTDPLVFNAINKEFNFSLDAACSVKNTKVPNCFLTKQNDSLTSDWKKTMQLHQMPNLNVWVNPPYGRGMIDKFMQKAIEEKQKGVTTVLLVPSTLDAQWLPIDQISEIRVITGGRLSFYHPITNKKIDGNTKGSMFVIFTPSKMPCVVKLIDRNELLKLGAES